MTARVEKRKEGRDRMYVERIEMTTSKKTERDGDDVNEGERESREGASRLRCRMVV